jgi:hypothetical protein
MFVIDAQCILGEPSEIFEQSFRWASPYEFYAFICSLFNDAVSSSDCVALSDRIVIELEMAWKEVVGPGYSWRSPEGSEGSNEKLAWMTDLGLRSESGLPGYESMVTTRLGRSVSPSQRLTECLQRVFWCRCVWRECEHTPAVEHLLIHLSLRDNQ